MLERLNQVITPTGTSYEVIFVNDGSRLPTSQALRHLAAENVGVKLIELSRNFGQQAAITCGLDHADGQAVVNIDSDLQDPPELIAQMIERWKEGYDVVYATRAARRDRFLKRASAFAFYRVLGAISTVDIPWDTGDYRLMDRKVVDALASLPEKTRFIRGMIPWLGFKQVGIAIDRGAREVGESTYTLKKLISLAMDGLLAFSSAPLYLISVFGMILTGLALLATISALIFAGDAYKGGLLLASAVAFFSGLQIMCVGIVAVYLSRVLDETRARPTYIVGARLGSGFITEERNDKAVGGREVVRSAGQSLRV